MNELTVEQIEKEIPHLKVYPVAILEEKRHPSAPGEVVLVDQFDDDAKIKPAYRVGPLAKFATPTQKFPISERAESVKEAPPPAPHYTWYPLTRMERGGAPSFRVYAGNQFKGIEYFEIAGAEALLVPAGKTHQGTPYPAPDHATHFKVYKTNSPPSTQGKYWLRDQFTIAQQEGYPVGHAVLTPRFFAVPCDKNAELRSGKAHLLIYEISPEPDHYKPGELSADDQFARYRLSLQGPEYLAVPTIKERFSRIT